MTPEYDKEQSTANDFIKAVNFTKDNLPENQKFTLFCSKK